MCEFSRPVDGVVSCSRCGHRVKLLPGSRSALAECRAPGCVHLGELVTPIKVECVACGGVKKPVDMPAAKCSQFGRCLPNYSPADPAKWQSRPESEIYHLCRGCEAFEPLPPAPPAE